MKSYSFLNWLSITLVVIILLFTAKAGSYINSGLKELTTLHSPTLISIQQMESDMFEATQEVFTYILLNDQEEKDEFYEKSADFDIRAQEFQEIARLQDEEQEVEQKAFTEIVSAKEEFIGNAERVFNDFETFGAASRQSIVAVESSIDRLTLAMDHMVAVEKLELDEHVEELEQMVMWKVGLLLFLEALLLVVLFYKPRKKKLL
jgi:hypothetical protein